MVIHFCIWFKNSDCSTVAVDSRLNNYHNSFTSREIALYRFQGCDVTLQNRLSARLELHSEAVCVNAFSVQLCNPLTRSCSFCPCIVHLFTILTIDAYIIYSKVRYKLITLTVQYYHYNVGSTSGNTNE